MPESLPPMTKSLRVLAGVTFLILMVTEFNNCGDYSSDMNVSGASALSCTSTSCVTPTADNLKITPHLQNGEYDVPANLSEFNIGGDCNEGGYPFNKIHWELSLNGVVVRNSSETIAGGPADTTCVNGRFLIYVNLAAIPEDNVDRTGLSTGAGRTSYSLNVYIYGETGPSGPTFSSIGSRTAVPLNAI